MKKPNYSLKFIEELKKENVLGTFCENCNILTLQKLFGKKDLWLEVENMETLSERIKNIIEAYRETDLEKTEKMYKAYNKIEILIEMML